MNRTRYVPFERNRYFYGKLLTVRDFMTEQTYNADKRRLVNRLLFGSGVVAGLQVVAVDDKSISVETGVALDQLGREIVVPSPLTLKLSNIEGFSMSDYAKNVYLCIAYDEKGKEPVHTATGATGRDEEVAEYNRILESYRLFIRDEPPSPKWQEFDNLIADNAVLHDDGQVRILQSVPRFAVPGETFELRLTVEKTLQTPHIEFEYEPEWSALEWAEGEGSAGKISFSEPSDGERTSYTRVYRLRALALPEGESRVLGSVAAKPGTMRLVVGDRLVTDMPHFQQSVEINEEPVEDRVLKAYYSRSLDRALEAPAEPCVYLARINLLQMGAAYVIDSVEQMPFRDFVVNPTLIYKLSAARGFAAAPPDAGRVTAAPPELTAAADEPFPDIREELLALRESDEEPEKEERVCTGIAEINIVPPKKEKWYHRRQRNFYSEEIEHGLGQGAVLLWAGISDEQDESEMLLPEMWNRSNAVYTGEQEVFDGSEFEAKYPKVTIGFVQYPKKGTFRIGVRVHKKTERTKLRIRWWAVKAESDRSTAELAPLEEVGQGAAEAAAAKS